MLINSNIKEQLSQIIEESAFTDYGFSKLSEPLSMDKYEDWIDKSYHGSMDYLKKHKAIKSNPKIKFPNANSAIVITQNYYAHDFGDSKVSSLRSALYAQGDDYHFWFKDKIKALSQKLSLAFPKEEFLCFTDSAPVLERDLANKAGLGWVGKNSCLINSKKGSLFFIGEIYTSLQLSSNKSQHPDRCGKCTKCIDACPTQALKTNRTMDARKCISYLTIENKEDPPENLRKDINDWFFGCDICQTVCPWNEKVFGKEGMAGLSKTRNKPDEQLLEELKFILTNSNKYLQKHFKSSPLARARGNGLKRNALIVIANLKLQDLEPEVREIAKTPRFESLAKWTLEQFN